MDQNILKDTVPPKNIEAEQAVLGALLLNWSEAIADVVSYLRPDRFYSVQNQVIFDAMLKLYNLNKTCDSISPAETACASTSCPLSRVIV